MPPYPDSPTLGLTNIGGCLDDAAWGSVVPSLSTRHDGEKRKGGFYFCGTVGSLLDC